DDVQEDVTQEVALLLRDGLAEVHLAADAEGLGHIVHHAIDGAALLRAAREVHAAEARGLAEHALLEELPDELHAVLAERRELLREAVDELARLDLALLAHPAQGAALHDGGELVEALVEVRRRIRWRRRERHREAPDLPALLLREIRERL